MITLVQVLHDTGEKFEPFLAKTVHETMGQLLLRVDLPRELRPRRMWRAVRVGTGPEAQVIDVTEVLTPNSAGSSLEAVILKPSRGNNYAPSWGTTTSPRGATTACGIYEQAVPPPVIE